MTTLSIAHSRPDTAVMTDLRLSLIAQQIGALLDEAAEIQGGSLQQPRQQGEMLVRLQAPGAEERCARAAARCVEDVIRGQIAALRESWEDHSQAMFLRHRLDELEAALLSAAELPTVAYWMAAREPERFCKTPDCGDILRNTAQAQRGYCEACWIRQAVTQ